MAMWARDDRLNKDDAVHNMLATVPYFTVGVLASAVFIFFACTRRLNRTALYLIFASLLAFVGSLLDVTIIFVRVESGDSDGSLQVLKITREVMFALSVGLVFFFFWSVVAIPPPCEPTPEEGEMHAGKWERWGIPGLVLRWGVAVACLAITTLQVLNRVLTSVNNPSLPYYIAMTVEVVTSAVLVLKLILNIYLVGYTTEVGTTRWKALRIYLPVMFAIIMGVGLNIGNMIEFQFTETALGKLLIAIEMYIVLLFLLVTAFYPFSRRKKMVNQQEKPVLETTTSFRSLPQVTQRESFFRISPVDVPPIPAVPQRQTSQKSKGSKSQRSRRPSLANTRRGSTASRISAWLAPHFGGQKMINFPSEDDDERLWNQEDAERGFSSAAKLLSPTDTSVKSPTSPGQSPLEPLKTTGWQDPAFTTVLRNSTALNALLADAALQPPPSLSRLAIPGEVAKHSRNLSGTDSPVYGLEGTSKKRPQRSPQSRNSILLSNILREQAESSQSRNEQRSSSQLNSANASGSSPEDLVASASHSEFSLSNFPEPPWGRRGSTALSEGGSTIIPIGTSASMQLAGDVEPMLNERREFPLMGLQPPQMPAAALIGDHGRKLSVPYSEHGDVMVPGRTRLNSDGVEYEITSFIGHLTHPSDASEGSVLGSPPKRNSTFSGYPNGLQVPVSPLQSPGIGHGAAIARPPFSRGPLSLPTRTIGLPPRPRLTQVSSPSPLADAVSSVDAYEKPRPAPSPAQ